MFACVSVASCPTSSPRRRLTVPQGAAVSDSELLVLMCACISHFPVLC